MGGKKTPGKEFSIAGGWGGVKALKKIQTVGCKIMLNDQYHPFYIYIIYTRNVLKKKKSSLF